MVFVLIAIAVLLVAAIVAWFVRKMFKSRNRIHEQVAQLDVELAANVNFYGVASKGKGQVRGNGALVLTPDEIVFFQLVPSREVRVPRAAVTGTEVARSFLGKTQGRDLLVVSWSVDGVDDKAAFLLSGIDAWRTALA